jgi:serine/threonine protein kinase
MARTATTTRPCLISEGVSTLGVELGKHLGHGGEKDVKLGTMNGRAVAILINRLPKDEVSFIQKVLQPFRGEPKPLNHNVTCPLTQTQRSVEREEKILELLKDSPHIMNPSLVPPLTTPAGVVRIVELLDGDLLDVGTGMTTFTDVIGWLRDSAKGLACMHDKGLVHMDFKPENIFTRGKTGVLADLGMVRKIDTKLQSPVGTAAYMDPKMMSSLVARPENDMFSFGLAVDDLISTLELYPDGDFSPMRQLHSYLSQHLLCKGDRREAGRVAEDLEHFVGNLDGLDFPALGEVKLETVVKRKANERAEFGIGATS